MLNFNAPLLSTRRSGNSSSTNPQRRSLSSSDRIPFSWEQAPGKPKNSSTSDHFDEGDTPRPKLPPGWWHRHIESTNVVDADKDECACDADDDVCDVDHDDFDDIDCYSNEAYSDAIDVFSLSEAIDIVEKKAQKEHETDGLKLKLAADQSSEMMNQKCTPNFIIERFLPDATALATSSALKLNASQIGSSKKLCYPWDYQEPEACASRIVSRSYSSPKGCGLHVIFPWRMKHKLCGVKSPVRQVSAPAGAQPQCSVKHKKHRS